MKKISLFLIFGVVFGLVAPQVHAIQPRDIGLTEGDIISSHSSDGDPDVYIINEHHLGARKRVFINEAIFGMYGHLGFSKVKPVTATQRDMFPTSNLFKVAGDEKVYCLEATGEDTGRLNWIDVTGTQAVQQNPAFFANVFTISNAEFNWYQKGPTLYSVNDCRPYARGGVTGKNYTLAIPNGWLSTEKNLRRGLVLRATNANVDLLSDKSVNFATLDLGVYPTYGDTMQEQIDTTLQWYRENFNHFQLISQTSMNVSGHPAQLLKINFDEVTGVKTTQYILLTNVDNDDVVYILTLGSAQEVWTKYEILCLGVIASLTIKDSADAGYVQVPIGAVTPTPVPNSGFTIVKPSGWEKVSETTTQVVFTNSTLDILSNQQTARATITARIEPANGFDVHQLAQFRIAQYKAIATQYLLLSDERLTIQGYDARLLSSSFMYGNLKVREYQLLIVGGDYQIYSFTGIVAEETWTKYEKLLRDTFINIMRI